MYFDTQNLELVKVLNKLLPYAQTNKGKELVLQILPSSNLYEIENKLNEVEQAFNACVKLSSVPLGGFKYKKDAVLRASLGGVLSIEELNDIAISLGTVRTVKKYRDSLESLKLDISSLDVYFSKLTPNKKIEDEILGSITSELKIADSATMDLFRIRKRLKMEETHLRNFMNSFLQSKASMMSENLIAMRDGHFTVPVKAEFKNQIKGIVRDSSSSGTTYFIEPEEAYKISAHIESILEDEKREINKILKSLSLLINSISEEMLINYENLVLLDVIYAKALYAINNEMIKPQINDSGKLLIKNGAHPLIDKDVVVKNDVALGYDYDTIIITGPNTGGKTVLLKMVGIVTLMMQCGLFVPCDDGTVLNVFDNIFSDIGDEQSIEQSLSTFSSHMTNITKIIDNLSYNSLVLLDELGSGTDPKEGASLAIAIIDYLTKKGSRVITTTHYSDLKVFAYNNPRIINASVEFKVETLKPTYKLQIGVAGRSNAILISKRLGLKEDILNHASEVYKDSQSDTSSLINKIDEENEKISAIKEEYLHKISEYNNLLDSLNREKAEIKKNYDAIVKKASIDASKILNDAKEKSVKIIEELNQLKDEKYYEEHKLADAKHKVKNLTQKEIEDDIFNEDIKVGDMVYIKSYGRSGEVKKIKNEKYEVQVGQFTMTFTKNEINLDKTPVKKISDKPKYKKSTTSVKSSNDAKLTLDLRGFRYEEVASSVDTFIDKAYLANMNMIYIIHGFGTGAVRDAVYSYLKKSPYVKSYRYGGEGEGLNGCTVVYLK